MQTAQNCALGSGRHAAVKFCCRVQPYDRFLNRSIPQRHLYLCGMDRFDFAVVGGGIVGAATFYKLQRKFPNARLVLLEKESEWALHQTGRNSGVIHSGLYYKPGSLKATTCRDGYRQLLEFCAEHGVAHEVCGKVVVATTDEQAERLKGLAERGKANGLDGLEALDAAGIRELEPHIAGVAGLRVPQTGIVDYRGATHALLRVVLAL